MKIGNNITYIHQKTTPSFGAIKFREAENTLRQDLSSKELEIFKKLVEKNRQYKNTDLVLYGTGTYLYGSIVDTYALRDRKTVNVTPIGNENKLRWIFRMTKRMRERDKEVEELLKKQNFQFSY